MHAEWDLVNMGFPARVFTPEYIAEKGQHHIVHYSSNAKTDRTYTDAIDVNALPTPVDPPELIYGSGSDTTFVKTDHCQFIEPVLVVTRVRNATEGAAQCRTDLSRRVITKKNEPFGINVCTTSTLLLSPFLRTPSFTSLIHSRAVCPF